MRFLLNDFSSCPNFICNVCLSFVTNIPQINLFQLWVHFLEYIISPLFYPFKQATVKSYHVFFFIKLSLKKKHHKEENNKSKIYCSLETFLGSSLCSRQLFEVVSDHWQLSCFYNTVIYFLNILFILGINVINHLMLR